MFYLQAHVYTFYSFVRYLFISSMPAIMNYVTLLKQGNHLSFKEVFLEYHQRLYFYFFKRTSDSYLAEDLVQDTFVKLWNFRMHLNEDLPFSTQLFRIAKTTFISAIRKKMLYLKFRTDILPDKNTGDAFKGMELRQAATRVNKEIAALSPVCKKVFLLSREEGLSYKEIARQLSISPRTVENHIGKAIKNLRRIGLT